MGIDRLHYHPWEGKLHSPWWSALSIVRVGLLQVFRRKAYWAVLALGLLQFLMFFAIIYAVTQLGDSRMAGAVLQRLDFTAEPGPHTDNGYLKFMEQQSMVVMILLAFSGSLLIGGDFRQRALPFYLSRRINPVHYILGKVLAVAAVVALLTVAPALLLFIEYGAFTSSFEYWTDNWRIAASILGYGAVLCLVLGLLLVTLSAYLQRMAPIAITWSSLFVLLSVIARQMREVTGNRHWYLLNPWRDMRYVGRYFLGYFPRPEDEELAQWAAIILIITCGVALAALRWRVRAVDVVE